MRLGKINYFICNRYVDWWWLWSCFGSCCGLRSSFLESSNGLWSAECGLSMKRKYTDRGSSIMRESLAYMCGCLISLNRSVCSTNVAGTMNNVNHLNEVFLDFRNSPKMRTGFEHRDLLVETNTEECFQLNACFVVHHWCRKGKVCVICVVLPRNF